MNGPIIENSGIIFVAFIKFSKVDLFNSVSGFNIRAYFVFVAMDSNGKPTEVPTLELVSEKEEKNNKIGAEIRKRQALEEKRFEIELNENL